MHDSALDPQNAIPVMLMQLARIYDLLAIIALAADEERAFAVISEHEKGNVLTPSIIWRTGVDNSPPDEL